MVAVSTVLFDGLSLVRVAEILSELRVAEVEVAYIEGYMPFDEHSFTVRAGRETASMFADHGVAMRAMSAHTDLGRADSIDRLLRRLDFAVGAGVKTVISNATRTEAQADFLRNIESVLSRFEDAEVVLALENPGHGRDAVLPDGRTGAALAARWDSRWLRLNYDIGNAYTYAQGRIDLVDDLDAALPFVQRVHLKDVAESGPDWRFCPVGAGSVGDKTHLPVNRLSMLDATLEHPLRLWRPGRADPVRRATVPDEADMRSAISASFANLRDLGFQ